MLRKKSWLGAVEGRRGGVHLVLFEHKSYPEPLIAFQLLPYMIRIWERDLRQPGPVQLTPILPVVVYHGRAAWQVPLSFGELFTGAEPLRSYWPQFHYHLTDLSTYRDEQIAGD